MPDAFQPPKGSASLSISGLLTHTMPASSRSAASIASARSVVKIEAPSPNGLSLASRIASSKSLDPADRGDRPETFLLARSPCPGVTPVRIVGS